MGCGAVLGCLASGILSDRFGRRDSIGGFAIIFIVGGVLQCASQNIEMQLIGRFISGISVGACSVLCTYSTLYNTKDIKLILFYIYMYVAPMYNAELAPKEIRGRLIGFQQLMIDSGMLISAWLDYGTNYIDSDWSWRIPYLVQIAPAILLALCPFLLPRSPRWLVEKGRTEEALDVLAYVHGKGDRQHPYVIQEFNEISDNVHLENNVAVASYMSMIKDPNNHRVLWIGCSIAIFQQLTGANVIMYYAAFMFQQAGLKGSLSLLANGIDCK